MKVLSIIGTRPQYIKFKPLHDALNKSKFNHIVIDSKQHYGYEVSKKLIDDLNLNIDISLKNYGLEELDFITNAIKELSVLIKNIKPDVVVVMGDTNTTFCASLVANKLKIPIGHIESGERSLTDKPEEINRQYCDSVSKIHFCSAKRHMKNVKYPVYTGDLEYELLKNLNPKIEYEDFGFLTLHRQENMCEIKIQKYFDMMSKLKIKIIFPVHHRTEKFLKENKIQVPKNVITKKPMGYIEAVNAMSKCGFIMTDSGGIQKCAPFFGKKCLVLRDSGEEWLETYQEKYCYRYKEESAFEWIKDNNVKPKRRKNFYCDKHKTPSSIIIENLRKI